jgi:L-aspartate oxidase
LYSKLKKYTLKKTDILIIGSGVAGLSVAIHLAERRPDLDIMVLSKTNAEESNTKHAQGGVAAVWNHELDSYEKHIADTLDAGDGLCDPTIVKIVVTEGPERVKEIISWGTQFDKNKEKNMIWEKKEVIRKIGYFTTKILPGGKSKNHLSKKQISIQTLTLLNIIMLFICLHNII